MTIKILLSALLFIGAISISNMAFADDETTKQKAEEMGNDVKRGTKSATRKVQDETCELVNGKMECAVQKTENSIKKGADKVEDAID